MAKQLKKWQGWLLFGGVMVIVFVLGLLCSSLLERRAEVVSVFNNKRTMFTDSIVSQNEKFAQDYPREYQTWAMTEDTTFQSRYNGSSEKDVRSEEHTSELQSRQYLVCRLLLEKKQRDKKIKQSHTQQSY